MTHPETSSDPPRNSGGESPEVLSDAGRHRRPSDFGELARTLRSRATDLIVIAIVAGAVLSLAGWVSEWWRNDPAVMTGSPDVLPPAPWESPDGVGLQFGNQPWTMHRRQISGDEASVTAALTRSCVMILEGSESHDVLADPDAAELRLLESLESFAPSEAAAGEWVVYELGGFLPWVVGVRESMPGKEPDAARGRRLVCWALALPQPDGSWVLHTIHRHAGSSGTVSDSNPPLPSGAQPSLRLFDERGGSLICVSGAGPAARWSRELDVAWNGDGWRIVREWTTSGSARSAVFSRGTQEGAQQTAEVVLSDIGPAEAVGTIIITTESVQADGRSEAP